MRYEYLEEQTIIAYPEAIIYTGGPRSYISITGAKTGAECVLLAEVGNMYKYRVRLKRTAGNGPGITSGSSTGIIFPLSDVLMSLWEYARGNYDPTAISMDVRRLGLSIQILYDKRITKSYNFILINGSPDSDVIQNRDTSCNRRRGVYWYNTDECFELLAPTKDEETIFRVEASWVTSDITSASLISNPFVRIGTIEVGEMPPNGNADVILYFNGPSPFNKVIPLYIDTCPLSDRDMALSWFDELGVFCSWRFTEEYNEMSVTTDATLTRMGISSYSLSQNRTRMTRRQTTHTLHSRKVPRDVVPFIKSILFAPLVWRYNRERYMDETMIVEDYKEKDYGRGYVDVVIKVTDTPQSYE